MLDGHFLRIAHITADHSQAVIEENEVAVADGARGTGYHPDPATRGKRLIAVDTADFQQLRPVQEPGVLGKLARLHQVTVTTGRELGRQV
jgi:hypothetical protein